MKFLLLVISTLCFVSTGFNLSVDAQDDFERRRHLKHEGSLLLTDIAQNVESNSQTAKYHFNLGNLYQFLGQPEKALAAFNQAIKFDPNYAPAYPSFIILGEVK